MIEIREEKQEDYDAVRFVNNQAPSSAPVIVYIIVVICSFHSSSSFSINWYNFPPSTVYG